MSVFSSWRIFVKFLGDIMVTLLASWLAVWIRSQLPLERPYLISSVSPLVFPQALLIYALVFLVVPVYDPHISQQWQDEVKLLTFACLLAAITFAATIAFTGNNPSRVAMIVFYGLQFAFCYSWRVIHRRFMAG
jgi:cytochrome bd-type quinol oxidase subunit 2